ncbi:MAG: Gfo/Idh/MocA family protein [Verrucomicrobiales bacterium]
MNQNSRRTFIKGATAAAVVGPNIIINTPGIAAPSERLTVGFIGVGGRGFNNLDGLKNHGDTQVLAVCDVDKLHYGKNVKRGGKAYGRDAAKMHIEAHYSKEGREYKGCDTYADYREICAREDIDAIAVSTPDHWHALATIEALNNGKDVYCEKPVTHWFHEGQLVYKKVAEKKAIFQTGSQQRSDKKFYQAVKLVQNGVLGKLSDVKVGLPKGHNDPQGDIEDHNVPENQDYDFWTGPAKKLPYMRATNHWNWRWLTNTGGGQLMDWIGHHQDINAWALDVQKSGPLSVQVEKWVMPTGTDIYDCPVDYDVHCEYEDGIKVSIGNVNPMGTKWTGENGWIHVTRGKITASNEAWLADDFNAGDKEPYEGGLTANHHRNFIDSCKSRKEAIAPAEHAHRSITPGHIAYVSAALGNKKLHWDAAKEEIVGDAEAQKLLLRTDYRSPWELKA